MYITKADGTKEIFKASKLERSLRRAGARKKEITSIVSEIESVLHDGMTTKELYRHAFSLLQKQSKKLSAHYSLRRALFGLGPTGFPFEQYLGRLFEEEGYQVTIGSAIEGRCARHELDLVASKKDDCFIAEAKFHMRPGIKSDMQVALYSYARFLDLKGKVAHKGMCGVTRYKIITNTKFTSSAKKYASCVGIELLSWDYPKKENLYSHIERLQFYPVTILSSFSGKEKQLLIKEGIILCRDIQNRQKDIQHMGISSSKIEKALEEIQEVCSL